MEIGDIVFYEGQVGCVCSVEDDVIKVHDATFQEKEYKKSGCVLIASFASVLESLEGEILNAVAKR